MKTAKMLLIVAVLLSATSYSSAQPRAAAKKTTVQTAQNLSPDALVKDLYAKHNNKKSPFFQTENRALVDKYFEKTFADLIWKDAVDSQGEVGVLGADPLFDAQDTDIKKFVIGQPKISNGKATVVASFTNFGKKKAITYQLVQQNSNWRIADIVYGGESGSLKSMYEEASARAEVTAPDENGNFEGTYQVGNTTCVVKPVKMAYEVRWAKGTGAEMFFSEGRANDKIIFASQPKTGKANAFSFDDESFRTGIFYRADGKELPIKKIK